MDSCLATPHRRARWTESLGTRRGAHAAPLAGHARHAHEFIGIQEAQAYLDFAARGVPKLVEEVVPKTIGIHQFTEVLQRLVQEGISMRDIKTILDALSEWGRIEKDPVMLTEYIRASLKRYLAFVYRWQRRPVCLLLTLN